MTTRLGITGCKRRSWWVANDVDNGPMVEKGVMEQHQGRPPDRYPYAAEEGVLANSLEPPSSRAHKHQG